MPHKLLAVIDSLSRLAWEVRQQAVKQTLSTYSRNLLTAELHRKQVDESQESLRAVLTSFFEQQVKDIAERLKVAEKGSPGLSGGVKAPTDTAFALVDLVYTPSEWDSRLVDASLPVLTRAMGEAATGYLASYGITLEDVKATSASEWLGSIGEDPPPGVLTEWPPWMVQRIAQQTREIFEQDFWQKVNETTREDIAQAVQQGLTDGLSTQQMARNIRDLMPSDYPLWRATRIARTEIGDVLNAGRRLGVDQLKEDLPEEVSSQIFNSWWSILADTTRATHANLHGTQEDEEGLFSLGGVLVPWPAHYTLPPGERINCYCTLVTDFGIDPMEFI